MTNHTQFDRRNSDVYHGQLSPEQIAEIGLWPIGSRVDAGAQYGQGTVDGYELFMNRLGDVRADLYRYTVKLDNPNVWNISGKWGCLPHFFQHELLLIED